MLSFFLLLQVLKFGDLCTLPGSPWHCMLIVLLLRCNVCRAGSLLKILLLPALHLNHFMVPVRPCLSLTWFVLFLLSFFPYNYTIHL